MTFIRRLFWLLRADIVYSMSYERKCQIPIPGNFEGRLIMRPGDELRVLVVRKV